MASHDLLCSARQGDHTTAPGRLDPSENRAETIVRMAAAADLSRDKGWEALEGTNLKWVTLVSVNPTWSAFALRLYRPGEPRQRAR